MGASYEMLQTNIEKEVADSEALIVSSLTKLYALKSDLRGVYDKWSNVDSVDNTPIHQTTDLITESYKFINYALEATRRFNVANKALSIVNSDWFRPRYEGNDTAGIDNYVKYYISLDVGLISNRYDPEVPQDLAQVVKSLGLYANSIEETVSAYEMIKTFMD